MLVRAGFAGWLRGKGEGGQAEFPDFFFGIGGVEGRGLHEVRFGGK